MIKKHNWFLPYSWNTCIIEEERKVSSKMKLDHWNCRTCNWIPVCPIPSMPNIITDDSITSLITDDSYCLVFCIRGVIEKKPSVVILP